MSDDTLLWFPRTKRLERTQLAKLDGGPDVLVMHRKHLPWLGRACVDIGRALLPPVIRERFPRGVSLAWLPVVPSQCVLVTSCEAGLREIAPHQHDNAELAEVLECLEGCCAWAFEEAFAEVDARELSERELGELLDNVLAIAVCAVARFSLPPAAVSGAAQGHERIEA